MCGAFWPSEGGASNYLVRPTEVGVEEGRPILLGDLFGENAEARTDRVAFPHIAGAFDVPRNGLLAFYDITGVVLPTQEIFAEMSRYIGNTSVMSRRAAVLTDSTIQRLQVRRMSTHKTVGFFTDRDEAEAWLFAGTCALAA